MGRKIKPCAPTRQSSFRERTISLAINLRVCYYRDMKKLSIPEDVMEYFRKTGAMGGKTRAAKHTPEELSKWGKMGGRPKGSGKKQTKKGGK